jgi:succinate-acetate transporter protein
MYLICSTRINIVFFGIFFFLDISLFLLTAAFYKASHGDAAAHGRLMVVSIFALRLLHLLEADKNPKATGACIFIFCILGWYLLFAQLLQSVEFPLNLPVGDLSRFWKQKVKDVETGLENSD